MLCLTGTYLYCRATGTAITFRLGVDIAAVYVGFLYLRAAAAEVLGSLPGMTSSPVGTWSGMLHQLFAPMRVCLQAPGLRGYCGR